jgi:hypothetical protein
MLASAANHPSGVPQALLEETAAALDARRAADAALHVCLFVVRWDGKATHRRAGMLGASMVDVWLWHCTDMVCLVHGNGDVSSMAQPCPAKCVLQLLAQAQRANPDPNPNPTKCVLQLLAQAQRGPGFHVLMHVLRVLACELGCITGSLPPSSPSWPCHTRPHK